MRLQTLWRSYCCELPLDIASSTQLRIPLSSRGTLQRLCSLSGTYQTTIMQALQLSHRSAVSKEVYGARQHRSRRPLVVQSASTDASPSTSGSNPPSQYRVSLFDAMKFNGPAPELINGRLAMVGFMNAALHESTYSDTISQQVAELSPAVVATLLLWVYASMVPILKGVKNEAFGPFSPRAEITNGRAAMLGLAVLTYLEYKAGVPFF